MTNYIGIDESSQYDVIMRTLYFSMILSLFFLLGCPADPSGPDDSDDQRRDAYVTYIYDGDTIQVNGNEKVRYTGIDTPELDECYYQEAKERNRYLVDKKNIELEVCKESPTDQYGRTLAHVYVNDTLVNAVLIRDGYAESVRIPPCIDKADYYEDLENEAREAGRGKWSACP